MPTTYNGVGTRYSGKKNLERRVGACPHCGSHVELSSYDTRLWFVVLFIPVIPLARKRIIDQCPACTRHFAVDADQWESNKQLEISGAQEKFRASPTPEAGLALHDQLLHFHEFEPAAEFRRTLNEKFSDNAKVHAHLGVALTHFSKLDEASLCFARALELRPDLPEARIGVAADRIRAGQLDQARDLLDFLGKPGASQLYSLEPLEDLGRALQKAGRHEEALKVFVQLQTELPTLLENKTYRKLVEKSEKALGRKDSSLPKLKFSWRRLFQRGDRSHPQANARTLLMLGAVAAIVLLGFAISNEYTRRHRTLHLVNATGQPATVSIDGVAAAKNFRGRQTFELSEGKHHATASGPVQEEFDFEVRADYTDRWFNDPAWVINVGGAAVLVESSAVYSRNPRPPTVAVHFGNSFESFWRITHPFRELPSSVQLRNGEEKTLVDLQIYRGESGNLFTFLLRQNQTDPALNFAESWLKKHPDDEDLLRRYAMPSDAATPRVESFLRAGLAVRPLRIEWHRAYQNLRDKPATLPALVAEYDAFLRAEPNSSALLYLRGRLAAERRLAREYFTRAAQTDPNNPYPLYALGYDCMMSADWAGAQPLLVAAAKLRPHDRGFAQVLFQDRLALGETAAIAAEAQADLARDPTDDGATIRLISALAAQSHPAEAVKAAEAFARAASAKYGAGPAQAGNAFIRRYALYATGDFAALEKNLREQKPPLPRVFLAEILIEQGRPAEAVKLAALPEDPENKVIFCLSLALAFYQAGETAEAERQVEAARQIFLQGTEDTVNAAALLRATNPPSLADVQAAVLSVQQKAVLVAVLAQRSPAARPELAALARRLNVERAFPYHLVQRVTADLR